MPIKDCVEVTEGSCTQAGSFCKSGSVTACDGNSGYFTVQKCEEENLMCKTVTNTYAVCINVTEQQNMLLCEDAGYKRCNPLDMSETQICSQNNWVHYETCSYGCNATSVNETVAFCNNLNTEGTCEAGDQFCHDTGQYAFQFVCVGGDWKLTTECNSGRCDSTGSTCYTGCSYLGTFCHPENNTCFYCNEEGDYIPSSPCLGEVDNITRTCSMMGYCTGDAYTCSGQAVYQCVNKEWRKMEDCSYGCSEGACSSEGAQAYEFVADIGDFLSLWIIPFGLLLAYISATGLISELLHGLARRIKKWGIGKD
jgi:hypothetical protein